MKNLLFLLLLTLLGCTTPPQIDFPINFHPQKIKIDLTKTTQVKTEHGLKINFNQEVIERIYGLTKTYNIEVRVYEFYTIEDFVFNNLETISTDGELLESAGMVKIELFYEHDFKVDLENASGVSLEIPTSSFDREVYSYKIYEGEVTENGMRWDNPQELELPDSEENPTIIEENTPNSPEHGSRHFSAFYTHELKNLNWINIDRLLALGDENLEEIFFSIENKYQALSLGIIIPGAKSYISLNHTKGDDNNYISNITLPKGENINIVGLGIDGEKYFLAIEETFVGKTDLVKLNFEEIPNEDLPERLK